MSKNICSSISENNGLSTILDEDQRIYSVGISTGGIAEMRMAIASPTRHITATTIDQEGAKFAQKQIQEAGLLGQIDIRVEDVAVPLPYSDGSFDFIYARLVLHYLPKSDLIQALDELYRVLKIGGRIFVVVRSTECLEAQNKDSIFDAHSGLTTYASNGQLYSRYFHDKESIQHYLTSSGFHIKYSRAYSERLCIDFQRTKLSEQIDALIEVLAIK